MFLAIFPLQLALFPGEEIPLHIFEPRYKQLVSECRDEGIHFGIPTYVDGNVSTFGTEVELVRILETYDTGEMDVVVRGLRVFHIEELEAEVPGKLYSGAIVEFVENDPDHDPKIRKKLVEAYNELFELLRKPPPDLEGPDEYLSFRIGRHVGLSLSQRVSLLAKPREGDRQRIVLEHIEAAIKGVRKQRAGRTRVGGNGKVRFEGD